MKKLLIISPHFPPINAPDMQRVRLALPYLRGLGWEPTVLAIKPGLIEGGVRDPMLLRTFPEDIRVLHSGGIPARMTRWAGIGSLWLRCGAAFRRMGEDLLAKERFDLAFFSTTQFGAFSLGPRWKQRHGLPYVLDYQDPWLSRYYERTGTRPPGGWLKYSLSQWLAARGEPEVLRGAAGVIAVSGAYGPMLAENYPWFDAKRVELQPFGASQEDFEALGTDYRPAKPLVDFDDGRIHLLYTGRCGPDMRIALRSFFTAFRDFAKGKPEEAEKVHIHFIGTDYAPPPLGREWALPEASSVGVARFVSEHPYRVPYFDALYYLSRAHALLAVGSDDPSYSPSKFYPYVLARKPMLMVFHEKSPVMDFARTVRAGLCVGFNGKGDVASLAQRIREAWFETGAYLRYQPHLEAAFEPFTAHCMAGKLGETFDKALGKIGKSGNREIGKR